MAEHMDVRRPKKKVKREIKRSNIALDEYMFDRKMQSLYYGAKPKSDDLPAALKWLRNAFQRTKKEIKALPQTTPLILKTVKSLAKKYPVRFLVGGLLAVILVFFVIAQLSRSSKNTPASQPAGKDDEKITQTIPLNQTPEFSVVLPQGKTKEEVGGFAKVSPPGSPPVYTFKDKIGDVEILVSEQLLPDSMKIETSKEVEKLAIGFNATQSVKTEKSEFFVGTNQNGVQSAITYTKTLLILIKTSGKIPNERWQDYIEDLK